MTLVAQRLRNQVIPTLWYTKPYDEYPDYSNVIMDIKVRLSHVINMQQATRCVYSKYTLYHKQLKTLLWTYSFHRTYDSKHMPSTGVQLKSGPYFNMSNLFIKIYNMLYYTTKLYLQ